MSGHVLRLNKLVLSDGGDPNPAGTAYTFQVLADEFGMGDTTPIETVMQSFLQDGAVVVTQGLDNRTVSFRVVISAPDSGALADGEAALFAEVGKPGELGWTPPDGWAPETVFDVFTSKLDFRFDDLAELRQGERAYLLTLTCYPYTRSSLPVLTPALDVPTDPDPMPITTNISAADSTTGWTANNATITDGGNYLRVSATSANSTGSYSGATYATASPIALTQTPYIQVRVRYQAPGAKPVSLLVNGKEAVRVAAIADPDTAYAGYGRVTFKTAEASLSSVTVRTYFDQTITHFDLRTVTATNRPPYLGTSRQSARTISVAGAARTTGSLRVTHATSGLGNTLIYTQPTVAAYSPALRQYLSLTQGATTSDTTTVSGARTVLDAAQNVFSIPPGSYLPGAHNVLALLKGSAAGAYRVSWYAYASSDGTYAGRLFEPTLNTATVQLTTKYQWVSLAACMLPGVDFPDQSSAVWAVFQFSLFLSGQSATLDEGYFLNTDVGDVTALDMGSARTLWVDGPTARQPRTRMFRGNSLDRSDSYTPTAVAAYGQHQFAPPLTSAWIVTSGAQAASASFEHYPRWHTHASDVSAA